ncbi:MAG TPA: hypothetical protein VF618_16890 [Thermoanaerobaculia bacterium]
MFEKCQNCGARIISGVRDEEGLFCSMECRNFFVVPGFCDTCLSASTDVSSGGTFTFNGVGTKLYGSKGPCEICGSVIQTAFICLLFVPVIPLARYRVKYVSPTRFLSRKLLPTPHAPRVAESSVADGSVSRRLNGWQRLFIVIAVIWLAINVTVLTTVFPQQDEIWDRYAYALIDRLRAADERLAQTSSFEVRTSYANLTSVDLVQKIRREYSTPDWQSYLSDVNTEYETELHALPRTQMQMVAWGFVCWAAPLLVLYVLGWSTAWVTAGFRTHRGAP